MAKQDQQLKKHRRRVLKAALSYAKRGWRVFPLDGKEPLGGTRGHLDATTKRARIKAWWAQWPDANIGIRCGGTHGPIVVDYDEPKNEREAPASSCPAVQHLPRTLKARSRSGRLHRFYLPPRSGRPIARSIRPFKDRNGRKYAVDILGDGYVIVAPSIHPATGQPYRWLNDGEQLRPFPRQLEAALRDSGKMHRVADSLPDVIPEGQRDDTLTSIAGTMRRRGMSPEAILVALRVENSQRVRPMLADKQLRKIARSIGQKPPVPLDLSEPITDLSLAERFAVVQANGLRYCPPWKKWLVWTDSYWQPDDGHEVDRRVERMVRAYLKHLSASTPADQAVLQTRIKEISKYLAHHKLVDVRSRAQTQEVFEVKPPSLNGNPYLFNVGNGTIDLETGKLRAADPRDMITKKALVGYNEDATCPRWHQFLKEITGNDQELITYLQRAVGYTMIGNTEEHCLFFCHGEGRNGKSTFLEVLGAIFSDYATNINFTTLLHAVGRAGGESRADLVQLYQARFVNANETPTNARWNEATFKQLTGGDTLTARKLYEENFSFTPTHTIWCRGNAKPKSYDASVGFWSRMKLIPFTQRFEGAHREPDLKERLIAENSGILNWAIQGCLDWRRHGLEEPASVRRASKEYQEEENVLGAFLTECTRRKSTAWTSTSNLYQAFTSWWADTHGHRSTPMAMQAFTEGLEAQDGLTKARRRPRQGSRAKVRGWKGIRLR